MPHRERSLTDQLEELMQFVYVMPSAVLKVGADGKVDMMNARAAQLLQALGALDAQGDGWATLAALDSALARLAEAMILTPGTIVDRHVLQRDDLQGHRRWLAVSVLVVTPGSAMVCIDELPASVVDRLQEPRLAATGTTGMLA